MSSQIKREASVRDPSLNFSQADQSRQQSSIMNYYYKDGGKKGGKGVKDKAKEAKELSFMLAQEKKLKEQEEREFAQKLKAAKREEAIIGKVQKEFINSKNKSKLKIPIQDKQPSKQDLYQRKQRSPKGRSKSKDKNDKRKDINPPVFDDYQDEDKAWTSQSIQGILNLLPPEKEPTKQEAVRVSQPKATPQKRSKSKEKKNKNVSDQKKTATFSQPPQQQKSDLEEQAKDIEKRLQVANKKILKNKQPFAGALVARSVQRLVNNHSELLTDMFIDDILIETVGLLNSIERKNQQKMLANREKQTITDFIEAFKDLAFDQDQIDARRQIKPTPQVDVQVFDYDPITLDNDKLDKQAPEKQKSYIDPTVIFENSQDRVRYIETSSGFIMKILEQRKKRINNTRKQTLYVDKNIVVFNEVSKIISEEMIESAAHHLEKLNDQLAEQIFNNEFK